MLSQCWEALQDMSEEDLIFFDESNEDLEGGNSPITVEILFEKRGHYAEILSNEIDNLNLPYHDYCEQNLLPDLEELHGLSKKQMLQKYCDILQKKYGSEEIPEGHIKQIIVRVIPRVICDAHPPTRGKENQNDAVSEEDKSIITYLSGAIIKWGLKKFKGQEYDWCKSQVSHNGTLPMCYVRYGKGLISPCSKFVELMIMCEIEFRRQRSMRKISVQCIQQSIHWKTLYEGASEELIKKILERYVRMRSHIFCHYKKTSYTRNKTARLSHKPNSALRSTLKTIHNSKSKH